MALELLTYIFNYSRPIIVTVGYVLADCQNSSMVSNRPGMLKLEETTFNALSWQFQLSTLGFRFQPDSADSDGVAKSEKVDMIRIIC